MPGRFKRKVPAIYWCEGERDADAVVEAGKVATTAIAHGYWAENAAWFKGYQGTVVVVADRDDAGARYALDRYEALRALGIKCRVREPIEGKDVRDHLEAGQPLRQLASVTVRALKERAKTFDPKKGGGHGYKPVDEAQLRLVKAGDQDVAPADDRSKKKPHLDIVMEHLQREYDFILSTDNDVFAKPCRGLPHPIALGTKGTSLKARAQREIWKAKGIGVSTESFMRPTARLPAETRSTRSSFVSIWAPLAYSA